MISVAVGSLVSYKSSSFSPLVQVICTLLSDITSNQPLFCLVRFLQDIPTPMAMVVWWRGRMVALKDHKWLGAKLYFLRKLTLVG